MSYSKDSGELTKKKKLTVAQSTLHGGFGENGDSFQAILISPILFQTPSTECFDGREQEDSIDRFHNFVESQHKHVSEMMDHLIDSGNGKIVYPSVIEDPDDRCQTDFQSGH